jgi:hypothetical protein
LQKAYDLISGKNNWKSNFLINHQK